MVEAAHANVIRLYYEKEEIVAEKSQLILQWILSDEDYVNLIAARAGDVVVVTPYEETLSSGFILHIILIQNRRAIRINGKEGLVLLKHMLRKTENGPRLSFQYFHIPDFARGKGLGTFMLADQVAAARTFGFDEIFDKAEKKEGYNGYYVWPSRGFDKLLTAEEKAKLPRQFSHVTYLSDLIELREGYNWWKKYGFALKLTFDTSPDSRSMRLLNAAIEKLHKENKYWDRGPELPLRIERLTTWKPHRDHPYPVWEYKQY